MITASLKAQDLLRKLQDYPGKLDEFLSPWIKRLARLSVSSSGKIGGLIQIMPPFSLSEGGTATEAKKRGENAVGSQIARVYGGPSELFDVIKAKAPNAAKGFWSAWKNGDRVEASKIAMRVVNKEFQPFDGGTKHKLARADNKRGRVYQRRPSMFLTDRGKSSEFGAYKEKKKKNVGLLASALVIPATNALGKLGGVPKWVSRHSLPGGSVTHKKTADEDFWTLTASPPFGADSLQAKMDVAIRFRAKAGERELPNALRGFIKAHQL